MRRDKACDKARDKACDKGCDKACDKARDKALYRLPGTSRPENLKHDPPTETRKQLRFFHYWRDPEGTWHSSGPLERPPGQSIVRPNIVVDKNDTVVLYWGSNHGFRAHVAGSADKWTNWRQLRLTGSEFTSHDACKHDRRLLIDKGILSFTADPNGGKEGRGYAILDFDIKDFGAAMEESEDGN